MVKEVNPKTLQNLGITSATPPDVVSKVVSSAVNKGVLERFEALDILELYIIPQPQKKQPRVFAYQTAMDETEAACKPEFTRTFTHADWVDGESVVQAEQTATDEGFNARFHKIEADLDKLNADTAQVFLCLKELRAEVFKRFDEVKAELNRINTDLVASFGDASTLGGHPPGDFALASHNHDSRYLRSVASILDLFTPGQQRVYGPYDNEPYASYVRYCLPDAEYDLPITSRSMRGSLTNGILVWWDKVSSSDGGDWQVHVLNNTGARIYIMIEVYGED